MRQPILNSPAPIPAEGSIQLAISNQQLAIAPATAQTFHDFFRDIPNECWLVGATSDGHGGFDALGHLPENQSREALVMILASQGHPEDINDGDGGPTPRRRILAALEACGAVARLQAAA